MRILFRNCSADSYKFPFAIKRVRLFAIAKRWSFTEKCTESRRLSSRYRRVFAGGKASAFTTRIPKLYMYNTARGLISSPNIERTTTMTSAILYQFAEFQFVAALRSLGIIRQTTYRSPRFHMTPSYENTKLAGKTEWLTSAQYSISRNTCCRNILGIQIAANDGQSISAPPPYCARINTFILWTSRAVKIYLAL